MRGRQDSNLRVDNGQNPAGSFLYLSHAGCRAHTKAGVSEFCDEVTGDVGLAPKTTALTSWGLGFLSVEGHSNKQDDDNEHGYHPPPHVSALCLVRLLLFD